MKVLVINGATPYGHFGAELNRTLMRKSVDFFENQEGDSVQYTDISESYDPEEEVQKLVWADLVIYHVPVWWFQVPYTFKEYLDRVFTSGKDKGMFTGDGRSRSDESKKYGNGGDDAGDSLSINDDMECPRGGVL